MSNGSILAKVRKQLMEAGASEASVLSEGSLSGLFDQMQELRLEMNQAKKEAADAAAKPYMESISALERKYAMIAKLSSRDDTK